MKKSTFLLTLIALYTLTTSSDCHKSNSPTNVLPPETHAGLNTMGCTVNGKLFIPQAIQAFGSPVPGFSFAQYSGYPGPELNFDWTDNSNNSGYSILEIYLDSVQLQAGITFTLGAMPDTVTIPASHAQWATYTSFPVDTGYIDTYSTAAQVTGQLTIDYYDNATDIGIVSGRFSFDAVDKSGDTVHIREGRFDMAFQY